QASRARRAHAFSPRWRTAALRISGRRLFGLRQYQHSNLLGFRTEDTSTAGALPLHRSIRCVASWNRAAQVRALRVQVFVRRLRPEAQSGALYPKLIGPGQYLRNRSPGVSEARLSARRDAPRALP